MKKLLIFAVMFGIIIGAINLVAAVDQGLQVTIGEDIDLLITPSTVDFGTVVPGSTDNAATNGPITFDASGSNVDVHVEVSAVTGFPFASTTLLLDGDSTPVGLFWDLDCTIVNDICTYTTASTTPTLDIPLSSTPGLKTGSITYTVTGSPP